MVYRATQWVKVRNMKLLVLDYLERHTFRELEEEYGVCARPSETFDKFSLNYDSILTRNGNPFSVQCRGVVVRSHDPNKFFNAGDKWQDVKVGPLEVLAWPMNRFFNHGQDTAAEIDWSDDNLRVYEKLDGTCIICYWDPLQGKWHAATRSVPEANLPILKGHIEIGDMTFSQLFLRALVETREELSGKPLDWVVDSIDKVVHLNKEMTYIFELVSPYNQIVVDYPKPQVYLLAARHTATGKEVPIESIRLEHVKRPKVWPIRDVHALAAFVDTADPSELEGAVVCDSKFNRLKVKNKSYVLAHKSKDSITASPRNALEAVILEKIDDIIPLVPKEVGEKMLKMQDSYAQYCKSIDANFEKFREEASGNRRRFAEQVMLSGDWTAPYFNLWENRSRNTMEWIRTTCDKNKLSPTTLDTIISKLAL